MLQDLPPSPYLKRFAFRVTVNGRIPQNIQFEKYLAEKKQLITE